MTNSHDRQMWTGILVGILLGVIIWALILMGMRWL